MANFKGIKTFDLNLIRQQITNRNLKKDDIAGNLSRTALVNGKLVIDDVAIDQVTPTALKQIWGAAGYNAAQIDLISDDLKASEREGLYQRKITEGVDSENADRMFRVINIDRKDGGPAIKRLYGVVSPRYKTMDNDVVLEIVDNYDKELLPVIGSRMSMDHSKFRFIPSNMERFNVGDHLPMVEVTNSESGMGALNVWAGVYTIKCTNGLMVAGNYQKSRLVHLGNDYTVPQLGHVFNKAVETVQKMHDAEFIPMTLENKISVVNFAKDAGLSHEDISGMIEYANTNYRNGRTLSDVVGAFTHSAQRISVDNLSRRSKIETVAGEILQRFAA